MHFFVGYFHIIHTCYLNLVSAVWFSTHFVLCAFRCSKQNSSDGTFFFFFFLALCITAAHIHLHLLLAPPTVEKLVSLLLGLDGQVVTGILEVEVEWKMWNVNYTYSNKVRSIGAARGRPKLLLFNPCALPFSPSSFLVQPFGRTFSLLLTSEFLSCWCPDVGLGSGSSHVTQQEEESLTQITFWKPCWCLDCCCCCIHNSSFRQSSLK